MSDPDHGAARARHIENAARAYIHAIEELRHAQAAGEGTLVRTQVADQAFATLKTSLED